MRNVKWNRSEAAALREAATLFRDNIWVIVEDWMRRLTAHEGESSWKFTPETQLIDNLPTLLRGVSKVIESPRCIADFEPEGIIYQAATELGQSRRVYDFAPSEVLYEQEVLRDVIWRFCQKNFMSLDVFELEQRINRPLDKLSSTITDSYINAYSLELKHLARCDKLTGLLNYDSFKELMQDELRRSRRYRHPFSLVMVDIDNFGEYDSTFGQPEGGFLLQQVSCVVTQVVRSVDIPCRYGADEFAIILPETSKKQARKVAERLRRAVKLETRHAAETRGDLKSPVTVSIGISSYPKDAEAVDELISLADGALFEAKKGGKDIVLWA